MSNLTTWEKFGMFIFNYLIVRNNHQNMIEGFVYYNNQCFKNRMFKCYDKVLTFRRDKYHIYLGFIKGKSSKKLLIFSHGAFGDIYSNYERAKYLSDISEFDTITFDYPGYGHSFPKKCSEENINITLKYVVDYCKYVLNYTEFIFMGYSLGCYPTIDYAYNNNWINEIHLVSPFLNKDKAFSNEFFKYILKGYDFDSIHKIKSLKCKIRIIYSNEDGLIDSKNFEELKKLIGENCIQSIELKNITHGNLIGNIPSNYFEHLKG